MLDIFPDQLPRSCLGTRDGVEETRKEANEELIIVINVVEENDTLNLGEGYQDIFVLVVPS